MKTFPENWHLLEEWENNFIFRNDDDSFQVDVTFTEVCDYPYSIGLDQLRGIFTIIGIENGEYSTNAIEQDEALDKAYEMMKFINKFTKDKSVIVE
jgi:hypothetical protein